jgi:hypothetical protein
MIGSRVESEKKTPFFAFFQIKCSLSTLYVQYKYIIRVHPKSTYSGRGEISGSVSALSAGAHTSTLLVMVDRVKGGGRAPRPPHQTGLISTSTHFELKVFCFFIRFLRISKMC